jgi:hypothetical protein
MRAKIPPRLVLVGREIAVISLFVVAAIAMTWPLLSRARTHIIDVGVDDTLLYTRYARCFRDWLIGREQGYLSFDMYFPSLLSGATDDASLGIAVQALPLSIFIRDYLFTINLITFASFVMCAHATYLLTRQLTSSRGAGIVAGLAFAFCFYRMRQLEHPHVLQMQWLPYALYFLHRLAETPTRKNAIWFTLFLFFACTASFNIAIYSAFVFPPITIWLVLTAKERRLQLVGYLVVACGLVGLSLLVIYKPFFILRDAGAPVREPWEIKMFSSHLESFHAAPAFSKNYGDLSKNMSDECATFLGWVVLALSSVGIFGLFPRGKTALVLQRREWLLVPFGFARAAALTCALLLFAFYALIDDWVAPLFWCGLASAIVFAVLRRTLHPSREPSSPVPTYLAVGLFYAALCCGPEITRKSGEVLGPGIWTKIQTLPGFDQVRTPARFYFVSSLVAAVLAGLGVNAVAKALPGKISRTIWIALAAFAVLSDLRSVDLPTRRMPTVATAPAVYEALAEQTKPGAIVEFPVEFNQRARQGVYYANVHGRPTINGMSGWGLYYFNELQGGGWTTPDKFTTATQGLDAFRVAHIAGLRYVVIHRRSESAKDTALYLSGIDVLGGHVIGTYGDDELFELPDPPSSRPARAADIEVGFKEVAWRVRERRETFVMMSFVNRTNENLYEPTVKHFSVIATSAGETIGKGDGYLFPPIFAPHGGFEARFRMKLVPRPRPDWVEVRITDDDGNSWGATRMKLPD